MIKVGIIGATGYAGIELCRLLLGHDQVEIAAVSSVSFEGTDICSVYPQMQKVFSKTLVTSEDVIEQCDVVFASLPHGLCEEFAEKCDKKNVVFIDLGADFRLEDENVYTQWYGGEYKQKELHKQAVYGLSELCRDKIAGAKIIANPGCYPTSVVLGLYPLLKNGLIDLKNIIIDSKSGVTGAGRGLSQKTHFPDCTLSFAPYNIGKHRHTPEIEQMLSKITETDVKVTFVPHLLPINRGIISTIYTNLLVDKNLDEINLIYNKVYENEYFVRMMPLGEAANLKHVIYSNFCDISLHMDIHTKKLIIVSTIDNMVKGAAGQAIQNMNIALGIDETAGLRLVPPAF